MKNIAANNRAPTNSPVSPDFQCEDRRLTLAIIGCGPRGLRVLDCLLTEYERIGSQESLEITLFEPAPSRRRRRRVRSEAAALSADEFFRRPNHRSATESRSLARCCWRQSFTEWAYENLPALDSKETYPSARRWAPISTIAWPDC